MYFLSTIFRESSVKGTPVIAFIIEKGGNFESQKLFVIQGQIIVITYSELLIYFKNLNPKK